MSFEKNLQMELVKVIPLVFPLVAPEGTAPPYCVYVSSYGQRDIALEGYLATRETDVTIHIVGQTYMDMKTYTNNVINALSGWQGKKIGPDLIYIQSSDYKKPQEMIDPDEYFAHSWVDFTFRY